MIELNAFVTRTRTVRTRVARTRVTRTAKTLTQRDNSSNDIFEIKVVAVGEGKSPEIPRGEDLAPVTAVVANNVGDGVHACGSGSGDGDGGSGGGGGGGGGGGDGGSSGGR
ncbi:hypothetical protein HZH68_000646 [Vespula germanica]|uniref:Uncharacterized protein n=1 Tax=Vespula germanica TaxID=30212 RepID=A0A834U672_VESGE|nr:hypothetical protein HZH68_000646 [Vespula germanica]